MLYKKIGTMPFAITPTAKVSKNVDNFSKVTRI